MAILHNNYVLILIIIAQVIISTESSDFSNFKDDISYEEHSFPEFKEFGQKKASLLKNFNDDKPLAISYSVNHNLEHSFEHNLISPKLPDIVSSIKPSIRYTDTPIETYEVTEDIFEPKAPEIPLAKPKSPLILGSGSLGFVKLENGKYALGSGSLGYSKPVPYNLHSHENLRKEAFGGLHVVPAPQLGSDEAFDAAFNNFDFKPLSDFFDHK